MKKLDQIEKRLETIREELNTKVFLPKQREERALSFTSEVKDHIDTLNLLQKENPKLKTTITKARQFIAAQIAPMPRVRLEFHEIYSAI